MSQIAGAVPPHPALAGRAAIVGLGETDYRADYLAARAREPGHVAPTPEGLSAVAFERALADAGLARGDIDGLSVSYLHGGPSAREAAANLGLSPRWCVKNAGIMAGPLPVVCAAIAEGRCDTVAMIYAVASRSDRRRYGGYTFGVGAPLSYYYHHPWGWSSQAAHWAFVWDRYRHEFGRADADLGAVAVRLRENAIADPQATMRTPLTIEAYLASRYVVKPLRLFDLCLVNDGGVCLIVRRADMARDGPHAPVLVSGWGHAEVSVDPLRTLVCDRLAAPIGDAAAQAYAMAGLGRAAVGHFEGYDASTIHLAVQLEGYGFAAPGTALDLFARGSGLPVNTAGGMLSGSYMHGWNHVAEIVRQLRHEAGARQVPGLEVSMFSLAQTDQVDPILFRRGA